MYLKQNELKIFYKGKINMNLNIVLKGLLKQFNYKMWITRRDIENHIENLIFKKGE